MLTHAFLGIIQGIFEWLPVSSEGVVAILSQFLIKGIHPIDIALFLHLGTLLAVLIYFREDWLRVLKLKDMKTKLNDFMDKSYEEILEANF